MSLLWKERSEVLQHVQAHQKVPRRQENPRVPAVLSHERFSERVDAENKRHFIESLNQMSYQSQPYMPLIVQRTIR